MEASEARLPVKRVRVVPGPSASPVGRAGRENPNEDPSASTREERTVAERSPAVPVLTRTRTGPKRTLRFVLDVWNASGTKSVSPGANVKVVFAAKAPGEKR